MMLTSKQKMDVESAKKLIRERLTGEVEADDAQIRRFYDTFDAYVHGRIKAMAFVELLSTKFALTIEVGTKSGPCKVMKAVLSLFAEKYDDDSERRATLHAAYLRKFPQCFSIVVK